jgi:hypothetical protein
MRAPAPPRRFIDSAAARGLAVLCFLLAAAVLAYLNRDLWLTPPAGGAKPGEDDYARCVADRTQAVEMNLREGVISLEQAAMFRGRAEALCRAQTSGPGGPPALDRPMPPLPPRS